MLSGYADRPTDSPLIDTDCIENESSMLRVFIAPETCFSSRCLAAKERVNFNEPLPSNDRRDTHTDTQTEGSDL
jgi:hypothetical protein